MSRVLPQPTAEEIRAMRERSGFGLMECKAIFLKLRAKQHVAILREHEDREVLCDVLDYLISRK